MPRPGCHGLPGKAPRRDQSMLTRPDRQRQKRTRQPLSTRGLFNYSAVKFSGTPSSGTNVRCASSKARRRSGLPTPARRATFKEFLNRPYDTRRHSFCSRVPRCEWLGVCVARPPTSSRACWREVVGRFRDARRRRYCGRDLVRISLRVSSRLSIPDWQLSASGRFLPPRGWAVGRFPRPGVSGVGSSFHECHHHHSTRHVTPLAGIMAAPPT